jgi:hypothetical protein
VVVWIQCFSFSSRGEAIEKSIAERSSRGSEIILAQWEGSVTRHGGMVISVGGEMTPRRGKGGDDASWANENLTG